MIVPPAVGAAPEIVAWSDTDPAVEIDVADSCVVTVVGQLTVMAMGPEVLPPSLPEVTVAELFTVPQVAVVVGEEISTVGWVDAPPVVGRLVPLQVSTPAVIEQVNVVADPALGVPTIVQLVPELVGTVSVTWKVFAVPVPVLETTMV